MACQFFQIGNGHQVGGGADGGTEAADAAAPADGKEDGNGGLTGADILSPVKWSMATAMGQKIAATTTLGRKTESAVEARNHTKIWLFMEVPMEQRALTEIRLSSPVVVQVRQMRSLPRRSTAISEKYWLIT